MSDETEIEKAAEAMIAAGIKALNNEKSIHAPCKNAHQDRQNCRTTCGCWRCTPQEGRR